ncbi:hypothetical protein ACOSQ2_022882 [Xanthoceras sorbifolium]
MAKLLTWTWRRIEEHLDLDKENHICRLEKIWNGGKKKGKSTNPVVSCNPIEKKKKFNNLSKKKPKPVEKMEKKNLYNNKKS